MLRGRIIAAVVALALAAGCGKKPAPAPASRRMGSYTPLPGGGSGTGVTDGNKGSITVSGAGTSWVVNSNAITNSMLAQAPGLTIKGNNGGASGNEVDLTPSQVNAMLGASGGGVSSVGATAPVQSSGGSTPTISLAASGIAVGSCGDASHVGVVTFESHGLGTVCTSTTIAIASSAVSGLAAVATSGAMSDIGTFASSVLAGKLNDETGTGVVPLASGATVSGWTFNGTSTYGGTVDMATHPQKGITNQGFVVLNNGNKTGASQVLCDFSNATGKKINLDTLTGPVTSSSCTLPDLPGYYTLEICQDGTGSRLISGWFSGVTWRDTASSSTPPTLSTGANLCDVITLFNDGSVIWGQLSGAGVYLPLTGGAISGAITGAKGYMLASTTTTNKGGANVALCDFTASVNCDITLTSSVTGTSTCTMPSGDSNGLTIWVHQDGTGSRLIGSWCPNTHWVGPVGTAGSAPTLSTAASALDIITCKAKGTNLYCAAGTSN